MHASAAGARASATARASVVGVEALGRQSRPMTASGRLASGTGADALSSTLETSSKVRAPTRSEETHAPPFPSRPLAEMRTAERDEMAMCTHLFYTQLKLRTGAHT
eukprot:3755656-Pleurochrysis_carterae.AAC.3